MDPKIASALVLSSLLVGAGVGRALSPTAPSAAARPVEVRFLADGHSVVQVRSKGRADRETLISKDDATQLGRDVAACRAAVERDVAAIADSVP